MSLHEEDKKNTYDGGFTAAVEPGHQVQYGEQPEVHSGLKRQLKSRHMAMISIGGVIGESCQAASCEPPGEHIHTTSLMRTAREPR